MITVSVTIRGERIITIKDENGNKEKYIGYTLEEAKKRFKEKFCSHPTAERPVFIEI